MIEVINELIGVLKNKGILSPKEIADNYYTIKELYEHRLVLFKIVCYTYSNLAWKTKKHFDGSMFNDSFLVGIKTPLGDASYHFRIEHYDEFEINEVEKGPIFDGYTSDDVINRINSLPLLGDSYIDTGKTIIPNIVINDDINSEKMSRLIELINELVSLLKDLKLIKTIDISDGNHTLKDLYKQKRELFKLICHNYSDIAWKSKYDINGDLVSKDTFMVGLNTPLGPVCYILNNEHYDEFNVKTLSNAPISKDEAHLNVIEKLSSIIIRQIKE